MTILDRPRPARTAPPSPRRRGRGRRRVALLAGLLATGVAGGLALGAATGALPWASASPAPSARGTDGLTAELVERLAAAEAGAAAAGRTLVVTSGYRTPEEQAALVDDAVVRYGSLEEAQRFVAPPEVSAHVQGTAVDVGDRDAAAWLEEHGEEYGLCRTYANEWWHFEVVGAVGDPCPPMAPDSAVTWEGVDAAW